MLQIFMTIINIAIVIKLLFDGISIEENEIKNLVPEKDFLIELNKQMRGIKKSILCTQAMIVVFWVLFFAMIYLAVN